MKSRRTKSRQTDCKLGRQIVKRLFGRTTAWPAARLRRFVRVGPGGRCLGLAGGAAKQLADVDWLVAMRTFVGCGHCVLVPVVVSLGLLSSAEE